MAKLAVDNYVHPLFELACEEKLEDEIQSELNQINDLFKENPDYTKLISSHVIDHEDKKQMIKSIFENKVNSYVLNLMFILIDNNCFFRFNRIASDFTSLLNKQRGILNVTAVTAVKLSDALAIRLSDKLSLALNKQILLTNEVDESVIGGVLLKYDNTQLDATVKTQLDKMKKQITATTM